MRLCLVPSRWRRRAARGDAGDPRRSAARAGHAGAAKPVPATPAQAKPAPATPAQAKPAPATPATATPAATPPAARDQRRHRLAAHRRAEQRHRGLVSAADRELDRPEEDRRRGPPCRSMPDRRQGTGARHDQDRRRHRRSPSTTASCGSTCSITEYNFKTLAPEHGEVAGRRRPGAAPARARARPRPAPRLHGQQPVEGEGGRGHQGRSAAWCSRRRRRRS